ncbi:uL13 family ribosomal protein [Candidatus Gottesmanbacteria bacterium]|nr:uL13 family ribosomal protein [Candidatus Gottesmanbacteria bacterium]
MNGRNRRLPSFLTKRNHLNHARLNAKRVKVTGKKEQQKIYSRFSGYPSGLKKTTLEMLRATKPEEIIRHAVYGMLPNNKLRPQMMKRLFVFSGNDHAYGDKFLK